MQTQASQSHRAARAFTLVEIMVAIAIIAISFVSLYAGITAGVQVIQLARENLRATQIMVEKTETIRIKSWSEITNSVDSATTFVEDFYPRGVASKGLTYHGTIKIADSELDTNYRDEVRLVVVTVRWTNAGVARAREMRTHVAREGMQNYVF